MGNCNKPIDDLLKGSTNLEATGNGRPIPVPVDHGDFVGSEDEFEVMEMAEGWENYGNGYFYPTCIGNVLQNRYRVDHKLGHGGFSVVWLAHDLQTRKDVALKILHSGKDTNREYNIVPSNILWGIRTGFEKYSIAEKYDLLGRPRKVLEETAGRRAELVEPAKFPPSLVDSNVDLCDFGILVNAGTSVPHKLQSPRYYCAAELFHGIQPSFASDLWSYMCVFFEVYAEGVPFSGASRAGILGTMVDRLGGFPTEWKGRYNAGDKLEAEDLWYKQKREPESESTFSALLHKRRPDINPAEKTLVLSVIDKVFRYLPESHLTALQLLDDPDFKALMRAYGHQGT